MAQVMGKIILHFYAQKICLSKRFYMGRWGNNIAKLGNPLEIP